MNVIWRFPIDMQEAADNEGRIELELPLNARILHLDVQERAPHQPSMWVLLDESRPAVQRTFELVGTGSSTEHTANWHVGSWQQAGYVWHLFEVASAEPWPGELELAEGMVV